MKAISKLYRKVQEAKNAPLPEWIAERQPVGINRGFHFEPVPEGTLIDRDLCAKAMDSMQSFMESEGRPHGKDVVMYMNPIVAAYMEYYPALWVRREKRQQLRNRLSKRRRM